MLIDSNPDESSSRYADQFYWLSSSDKWFLGYASLHSHELISNDLPLVNNAGLLGVDMRHAENVLIEYFSSGVISNTELQRALTHWNSINETIFLKQDFRGLGFSV